MTLTSIKNNNNKSPSRISRRRRSPFSLYASLVTGTASTTKRENNIKKNKKKEMKGRGFVVVVMSSLGGS